MRQYPTESEVLFAPCCGFEVENTRVEGSVLVVNVRVSVNLLASTIEQVVREHGCYLTAT